ncbi:MAG TPA: cytochrome c biogenesis protein ResB [Pseudogracilibacillus sp.]|nr:cytochrome c biogenesis protein ResB [Pseudogracilibacillus sp.]
MSSLKQIKCECGHVNPEGTVLCEACGKPVEGNEHIDGNDQKKLLNMRYEGSARRSQTYNRTIVDKVWNFFSSVKVGVMLIVLALIASGIGTIFPQEQYIPAEAEDRNPEVFYEDWYGIFGKVYYELGFHNLYGSTWYIILIALIGVSLVICSIDRYVPLRRALKMQRPKKNAIFLSRQRLYSETETVSDADKEKIMKNLKKYRYNIFEENGNILAEKNRFSRWGPYVNHIGLIIILFASILRMTPIFFLDDYVWVREGEQKVIPSTDNKYHIENKKFTIDFYEGEEAEKFAEALERGGEVHKNYQTDVVIYENESDITGEPDEDDLKPILESSIQMNKPLKFGPQFMQYTLYQSGYQQNEFSEMSFKLFNIDSEEEIGELTIDLYNPEDTYDLGNGYVVELNEFYPEYELKDGVPRSKTKFPRNPAFILVVHTPEGESEVNFLGIGKNISPNDDDNEYRLGISGYELSYASGLTVRRDYTLPLFGIGALIFMIGVVQGMYWQHRRIWINPKDDGLIMAAHTNKNWHSLQSEIEKVIDGTNVKMVVDQSEDGSVDEDDTL